MFTLITKENMANYIDEIKSVESLYFEDDAQDLESYLQDGSMHYILYKKDGAYGGAKVVAPEYDHEIEEYLKSHDISLNSYWVLEDIIFHVPNDLSLHEDLDEFEAACRAYYKGLYQVVKLLGHQHGKATLLTLNPYEDHEDIMFFGDWPFTAQHIIPAEDEADDTVLGLLVLEENKANAA